MTFIPPHSMPSLRSSSSSSSSSSSFFSSSLTSPEFAIKVQFESQLHRIVITSQTSFDDLLNRIDGFLSPSKHSRHKKIRLKGKCYCFLASSSNSSLLSSSSSPSPSPSSSLSSLPCWFSKVIIDSHQGWEHFASSVLSNNAKLCENRGTFIFELVLDEIPSCQSSTTSITSLPPLTTIAATIMVEDKTSDNLMSCDLTSSSFSILPSPIQDMVSSQTDSLTKPFLSEEQVLSPFGSISLSPSPSTSTPQTPACTPAILSPRDTYNESEQYSKKKDKSRSWKKKNKKEKSSKCFVCSCGSQKISSRAFMDVAELSEKKELYDRIEQLEKQLSQMQKTMASFRVMIRRQCTKKRSSSLLSPTVPMGDFNNSGVLNEEILKKLDSLLDTFSHRKNEVSLSFSSISSSSSPTSTSLSTSSSSSSSFSPSTSTPTLSSSLSPSLPLTVLTSPVSPFASLALPPSCNLACSPTEPCQDQILEQSFQQLQSVSHIEETKLDSCLINDNGSKEEVPMPEPFVTPNIDATIKSCDSLDSSIVDLLAVSPTTPFTTPDEPTSPPILDLGERIEAALPILRDHGYTCDTFNRILLNRFQCDISRTLEELRGFWNCQ